MQNKRSHELEKTKSMNEKSSIVKYFVLDCLRVFSLSSNLYMMTQGMAQQTGRQMGITAAPPYPPLALDSDSDALAECLAANFIFPLDLPPIFFDFFSKVRDCLQNNFFKINQRYRMGGLSGLITKIGTSFFVNIL